MTEFKLSELRSKTSIKINTSMLFVHVLLLLVFWFLGVMPMFFFNIGSIIFYLLCYILIKKDRIILYVSLMMVEILSHLTCAVFCCGWSTGFQYYCFGIVCAIYYTYYYYKSYNGMKFLPAIVNTFSIATYVFLKAYTKSHAPLYAITDRNLLILEIVNTIIIFVFIIVSLHDFTRYAQTREKDLAKLADNDELTQLFNRHKMNEILQIFQEEAENGSRNFCISMVDIDNFKEINDTYGHDKGDDVLVALSKLMKKISYEEDTWVARWGGEEFLIAQQYHTDDENGVKKCQDALTKVHERISQLKFTNGSRDFSVTITAGFSVHQKKERIEDTIKAADDMLYAGKNKGKNTVVFS